LDDIYNTLYANQRSNDERSKRPQVDKRKVWEKLVIGVSFALGLILIILGPIFVFSSVNPVMQTNPTHSGKIEIDLELIATGNTYRIFENQGNKLSNLTQAEDNSWRLYFEPESNQIELQDMQKVVFNTFSDVQWTISPPSLKSFIKDFQNVAAGKSDDEKLVNFILHWEF